jgi:hypothetical protein
MFGLFFRKLELTLDNTFARIFAFIECLKDKSNKSHFGICHFINGHVPAKTARLYVSEKGTVRLSDIFDMS